MTFEDRIAESCRNGRLLSPGQKVICALSGGADSVALLWSLYLLKNEWNLSLEAAHFNHGLRGSESDSDEEFVKKLCGRYNIPLHLGGGVVQVSGRGLEDAARRARYAFLESLDPNARIATAHTADDNAETVLLHLLRGSGLRGLGGITPCRGRLIRPMLSVTRQEVEEFLALWNLTYVMDSSNREDTFLRNRLRHQVMPVFHKENPRFSENCSQMAGQLRQDEDYLNLHARQALETLRQPQGLDRDGLLTLHPALKSRVVVMYLKELGLREPERHHVAAVLELAESTRPSSFLVLPNGVILRRQYRFLTGDQGTTPLEETEFMVPGVLECSGWRISATLLDSYQGMDHNPWRMVVHWTQGRKAALTVRPRHPGDKIALPGGHKSLKRAMIDRKIPAALRDCLPVFMKGDRLLAVAGLGANLDWAAKPGEPALLLEVHSIFTESVR